ncbi:MAG: hypothetical protein GX915_09725 [Clostridiales bacterium]|nr:hypothetical protein [Clostridiales bacterium]
MGIKDYDNSSSNDYINLINVSSNNIITENQYNNQCIISNVYQISNKEDDEVQIRFRYLYLNPLYKEDLLVNTDIKIMNGSGKEITEKVMQTRSETFFGCQGITVTITFNDETYKLDQVEKFKVMSSTLEVDEEKLEINPIAIMSFEFLLL